MNNNIKKGINVLSCFDGMSCGQLALQRAGIKVNQYYASEIDKYAISITQKNWPNTIQLGDVSKINSSDLPKIDLLIGGSPCQGFSLAGKQLNFEDPRSKLFFEFVRLKKELKPKYFLLENVRMKKDYLKIISEYLNTEPVFINSALLSAQNRPRYYWTNFNFELPTDKGILLKDIVENGLPAFGCTIRGRYDKTGKIVQRLEFNNTEKSNALTTMQGGHRQPKINVDDLYWRKLTPLECERLQTVPDGYTEGVSNSQRYKMLGNGWTVDVIAHIFSFMDFKDNLKHYQNTEHPIVSSDDPDYSVDVITYSKEGLLNIGFYDFKDEVWKFHTETLSDPYEDGKPQPFIWFYLPKEIKEFFNK